MLEPVPNEDILLKLPDLLKGKFTQINLTGHALLRMDERNITQEEVMEVLQKPHGSHPLPDQPKRTREFINKGPDEIHVV